MIVCLVAFGATHLGAQQEVEDSNDSDTFTPSGAGIRIPDDAYDGTLATMVCMTTDAPAGTITAMDVDITVDHFWVGDLAFQLVSPSDEVMTMMRRPGYDEAAD